MARGGDCIIIRGMTFFLRNTLTNRREEFVPRDAARPAMYVCGPTVYGPAHVGNARPAAVFDLVARVLKTLWPGTVYARNITDIDDKIIAAAGGEGGEGVAALALRCAEEYRAEMSALNIRPPDFEPRATAHIAEMLEMIARLLEKNFAYEAEGHVLFHTESFSDYGALSNRSRDEMIAGARVEVAPYKRDAADFVLWKPSPEGLPGWESPWGRGRPGWHLECSAMAAKCLGTEIDLHGGGQDLIFPHHENEIAQSRCAHGAKTFARYWMHNGHVSADGEKMSKSLGNVFLTREALADFPGEAVRWALLSAHYRRPLRWSESLLRESRAALDRLYESLRGAETVCGRVEDGAGLNANVNPGLDSDSVSDSDSDSVFVSPPDDVFAALRDDLNTPQALSVLHSLATKLNRAAAAGDLKTAEARRRELLCGGRFMGFLTHSPEGWMHSGAEANAEVERMIAERDAARARKDFAAADAIRRALSERGIEVSDSAGGATWRRVRT